MPLTQGAWPMLTDLSLSVCGNKPNKRLDVYPTDLFFPKVPLRKLELVLETIHLEDEDSCEGFDPNIAFVSPLLESCPELLDLEIEQNYYNYPDELATAVVATPLTQLTRLAIRGNEGCPSENFYPILFERDWSLTLKRLRITMGYEDEAILSLLASLPWVNNLESFYFEQVDKHATKSLHAFLKSVETGAIQSFTLDGLDPPLLLEGFKDIKIENLKSLCLNEVYFSRLDDPDAEIDASAILNVLFEGCSFPNLKKLTVTSGNTGPANLPKWSTPPTKERINPFPELKMLSLSRWRLSRDVCDYLGNLRKQTDCEIDLGTFKTTTLLLTPYRQELLDKLGINFTVWGKFCKDNFCYADYMDGALWDVMLDDKFKKIAVLAAYTSAIEDKSVSRLGCIIKCYRADPEGSGLTVNQVETAEAVLKQSIWESQIGGFTVEELFELARIDKFV